MQSDSYKIASCALLLFRNRVTWLGSSCQWWQWAASAWCSLTTAGTIVDFDVAKVLHNTNEFTECSTDKVKFSGSSVDHEAGELEVCVVQWPDTGAPSLCCAAITILGCSATATILFIALTTTICPLWCQQCTRGVAHCSNTGLYLLPSSWGIYVCLNNICLQSVLFIFTWF